MRPRLIGDSSIRSVEGLYLRLTSMTWTILAAERTGRRGYGIEIDPLYVDTALQRWQRMTGNRARHACGQTFADIKAERRIAP